MSEFDYAKFNHITNINEKYAISQVEDNLKHFLDWSFLQIDAYVNVNMVPGTPSGLYTLNPQPSPTGNPSNKSSTWEGPTKDWVYENGDGFDPSKNINQVSGIYLNNTFLPAPTGSGNYGYHVNYPLGKITFDNPVSINSSVKLDYAYRYVQIYKSNESVWWKELTRTLYSSINNSPYSQILSSHKIQMPFIMIEIISRNNQEAYELGNSKNMITQDILFHIFTETVAQRVSLMDILLTQKDKGLILYDINKVVKNAVYPLNYRGEQNLSGLPYNQLVSNSEYQYKKCYVKSADTVEMNNFSTSLFNGIIRWSLKIFP
jgi:hypothetical protein